MPKKFEPAWLPTAVGSLPLPDPVQAWSWILKYLPQIPFWPQLPRSSYRENMYAQYAEGFPAIVVDLEAERTYMDRRQDMDRELENLYMAYLQNDREHGSISTNYAAGLHHLFDNPDILNSSRRTDSETLPRRMNGETLPRRIEGETLSPVALKGHVTGPVSWGLMVVDENRRPLLYDDTIADAVAKHLRLKASWQEKRLRAIAPQTIMFVDEPYMSSFGSGFISLSREQVVTLLGEVFAGIEGLKGIHCCANTDWSVLLETPVDILNLDAYEYAESLALYPDAVAQFLERGGTIAWGIVPSSPLVEGETVESLVERLHMAIDLLVQKGVSKDKLLGAGLVTPSCGTGSLDPLTAERVLELTAKVSAEMRARYVAGRLAEQTAGPRPA